MARVSVWHSHRAVTRRAAAIAGATVAALLSLPPLFGQFFYGTDLTRIDLGLLCAIKERLAAGASLQLSPLLGNGGPLLARPDAQLFYPPRWIALALPPDHGVAFEVIFHLAIAAAATAWLARTFGVRIFGAAAAGIAFGLSGTVLDLLRHAHYLVAAAWLPLVWAGTRVALQRRSGSPVLLAVFCGCVGCLLGAEPQAFGIAVGLVAIEVAVRLVRKRLGMRKGLLLGLCCASAFLVGLVQWAPALGELTLTPRAENLRMTEAMAWSMTPAQWIGVVLPGMPSQYVQGVTTLTKVVSEAAGTPPPWNKTPYLGALLVCAAIVGLGFRRARSAAIVAVGGTLFSLGDQLPVLPLLIKVAPFLARFRYPSKYWLVTSLALIVLGAIALDALSKSARVRRQVGWVGAALAGFLTACAGWVLANAEWIDRRAAELGQAAGDAVLPTLSQALEASTLHALAALVAGMLLLLHPRLRHLISAVVCLDLLAAAPFALMIGPPLAALPTSRLLTDSSSVILCVHPGLEGRFFPFSTGSLDRSTLLYLRAHQVPELQACSGVKSGIVYSPLESTTGASLGLGVRASNASAVRAFGCTHLLSLVPFAPDAPVRAERFDAAIAELGEASAAGDAWLFELPDPLANAFVSSAPVLSPTASDAIVRVARARSREELIAVVDDPLGRLGSAALPSRSAPLELFLAQPDATRATLRLEGKGAAVVGLRIPFLVGWTATQTGKALPVIRVAGHQLGFVVDDVTQGSVELTYRAPNLSGGVMAALAGLALLAAAMWVWQRPNARAQ